MNTVRLVLMVAVALVCVPSPLLGQAFRDTVIPAQMDRKLGPYLNLTDGLLVSCEDYMETGYDQRRWFVAGMNQALHSALVRAQVNPGFAYQAEELRGDSIGKEAGLRKEGLDAGISVIDRMLPTERMPVRELAAEVGIRCLRSGDQSLPVVGFYVEAVAETWK